MSGKKFLTLLGMLLVGLSLYYILQLLLHHRQAIFQLWHADTHSLFGVFAAVLIYAAANCFLLMSWIRLLSSQQQPLPEMLRLIKIFGTSQMAKYVPGNILHIAGRHVMGRTAGVKHQALVYAAFYEIAGLLCAAAIISLMGVQLLDIKIDQLSLLPWLTPVIVGAYFLLPKVTAIVRKQKPSKLSIRPLSLVLVYYLLFFFCAGAGLLLLVFSFSPAHAVLPMAVTLSAFAIAWSAGYITPGAPSGIGIRESILIFLMTPVIGVDEAVLVALLFRVVTVLGDLVFMVGSSLSGSYRNAESV